MAIPVILASASVGRLQTLRGAGIEPAIIVSTVDEDAILADPKLLDQGPEAIVLALAQAKSRDVAAQVSASVAQPTLVLGGDSMFEFAGNIEGKPHLPDVARQRLRAMQGKSGTLHTGHYLYYLEPNSNEPPREVGGVSSTIVHIGQMTDAEIEAYLDTGEPLEVAGCFTIDGYGGPFITGIEGDHHGVTGLSLPLLRSLVGELNLFFPDLWSCPH